jgi:hypothetical protein
MRVQRQTVTLEQKYPVLDSALLLKNTKTLFQATMLAPLFRSESKNMDMAD